MPILIARCRCLGLLLLTLCLLPACQPSPGAEVALFAGGATKPKADRKINADGRGASDGWYRSRHANGQVHEQGLYLNGKMHGEWTVWDEHGRQRGRQQYVDGRRHGQWTAWHPNGRIARRWQYTDDEPHGLWQTWDEAGNLIEEVLYNRGKQLPSGRPPTGGASRG